MTASESQAARIHSYMAGGGVLTQRIASRMFDCDRLGARIYDLKRAGVPVKDGWEYRIDAAGRVVKKWKRYWIA